MRAATRIRAISSAPIRATEILCPPLPVSLWRSPFPEPEEVWAALNGDNKVSLYTNVNGEVRLFNKNLGD